MSKLKGLTRQQKRYVYIWLPMIVLGLGLLVASQVIG